MNFYSVNYVFYSGIGLNVKYQKKNWIGWSNTKCEELTWGWDGILYSYNLPSHMPTTGSTPTRKQYTYVPGVKNKKAYTINLLEHEIDIDYTKGLKVIKKKAWKWLENELAPEAIEMKKNELSQFRQIFPNKVKVIVNPYHETEFDKKSFSKLFDWGTCEVSINFLNGTSFLNIFGLKNNAMDFNVEKISIYGIAKQGSIYKGIGITKN